jgi:hypothetical protein
VAIQMQRVVTYSSSPRSPSSKPVFSLVYRRVLEGIRDEMRERGGGGGGDGGGSGGGGRGGGAFGYARTGFRILISWNAFY